MSSSWSNVLSNYSKLKDPEINELPKGVCLEFNNETLTIFDGFEKAKYHFLILPRDPFPIDLSKGEKPIPSNQLDSLSNLMKSPLKLKVLKSLEKQAERVKKMIQDEMKKDYKGFVWDVKIGFHAVESMKHVHLHVISSDMISDRLKNKKHWNSFHPTLGFFLHLDEVIKQVESNGTYQFKSTPQYESLLKKDLNHPDSNNRNFKNLPELKKFLVEQFERDKRRAMKKIEEKEVRVEEEEKEGEGGLEVSNSNSNSKKREKSPPSPSTSSSEGTTLSSKKQKKTD
ncbi:hypothetical protein JCM3765_000596 [Sporobolomyces pararoseus]